MGLKIIKLLTVVALAVSIAQSIAFADPVIVLQSAEIEKTPDLYIDRVKAIQPGSTVVFETIFGRKSFRLGKHLGSGNTTLVFELLDYPDRVIRIPKSHYHGLNRNKFFNTPRAVRNSWLNGTIKGHSILQKNGIPIIQMHDYQFDQYVIVDRVEYTFNMSDYLFFSSRLNFSEAENLKIENELREFSEKIGRFDTIGDFGPGQVVYDKKRGWVVIDWSDGSKLHKSGYDSPFEMLFEAYLVPMTPPKEPDNIRLTELTGLIYDAIYKSRRSIEKKSCFNFFLKD